MLLLIEDQARRCQDVSWPSGPKKATERPDKLTSPSLHRPSLIVGNFLPHDPSH